MRKSLIIVLLLAGCGSEDITTKKYEPSPVQLLPSREEAVRALDKYGANLVERNPSLLLGHHPVRLTSTYPRNYRQDFITDNREFVTQGAGEGLSDEAIYQHNIKITNRWTEIYCTEELKSLMRKHGVFQVLATIIYGPDGSEHSIAGCHAK